MQLETVGEIVRVLRSRRKLEQVELARACGWRDASAVSRIETDRIRPTKRTLLKLAGSLADPEITGTPDEVRAWLFLAAGIPPTRDEVDALADRLPSIEAWTNPAAVLDFAWTVWRMNALYRKMLGFRTDPIGKNYIELFFRKDGAVRQALGDSWSYAAEITVTHFRAETERRSHQRWHRKLLERLRLQPDFERMWEAAKPEKQTVRQRHFDRTPAGDVGTLWLPIAADPRLRVALVVPEDAGGTRSLEELRERP